MEEKQKAQLRDLIEELEQYRGRHTELITVYAPQGSNINQIANQIVSEQSTAQNIKSKTTRTNVIDALERIIRHLKLYKKIPDYGLVLFCGNISKNEGQPDLKIWAIEPPQPLRVKFYRCDQIFVLDPLKEMLKATDVYGLVVMDRREATIGVLEGKAVTKLKHLTSGVPGKFKTGGQCLDPESLIMLDDGDIISLKNCNKRPYLLSCDKQRQTTTIGKITSRWENNKKVFEVITKYPQIKINSSLDHTFFVRTEKGIEEKPLSKIKIGDYLIMPEKINLKLKDKEIDFTHTPKRADETKQVEIPKIMNRDFARLLGYYLGDGSYELDRLSFSEQREDVAQFYKKLIEKIFGVAANINYRKDKNYYQIRIYSRTITHLFKKIFDANQKTLNEKIPPLILQSSNESLAAFIAGFFDAEGYISSNRIGLGINNGGIQKQLQIALLRFGIISSILQYNNKRNPYSKKTRYTLVIDDTESIRQFSKDIGFSSNEKSKKLLKLVSTRIDRSNVRQILVNGKEIRDLFREHGEPVHQFGLSGFFSNKRQLNKILFKERLIENTKNPEIRKKLLEHYNSNLIPVKIKEIKEIGEEKTVDIETSSHNFFANGILVHNSAARFDRLTEEMAKEFYRRIADSMKEAFADMTRLKGIIVGGPGPTKEDFIKEGDIAIALKRKIIAVKDVGYTDEQGLDYLVELSQEDIASESIVKEKKILKEFFETLGKNPSKAAYELGNVKKALEHGAVQKLILYNKLDKQVTKELEAMAETISSEVFYVSDETNEGLQFKNLGGVGALLRFAIG